MSANAPQELPRDKDGKIREPASSPAAPPKKQWSEFRETGLLLFVNTFLHIFGWSIVVSISDTGIETAYPARTEWKGFPESNTDEAYRKLEIYIKDGMV
ncbi:hypothetical protein AGMMS49944_08950 [Spirochaetia bacterium]|nr:hypothetical protein AGMMS49944_08950 [Spirochaetia bacterium]